MSLPDDNDPYVKFYDDRSARARDLLVFMEETKIWQELLKKCTYRAGPNATHECRDLFNLVQERVQYFNSKYRQQLRPTLSPGIDPKYEKTE